MHWSPTTLGSSCPSAIPGLPLGVSPTIPSGSRAIGSVKATVTFQTDATPGPGAGHPLTTSIDLVHVDVD